MEQYQYEDIDLEGPAIRLCRLSKGNLGDDIELELDNVWLDTGMPYLALSYTWGSQEKWAKVKISGRKFNITYNLYGALTRLRKRESDQLIWVDAICINQDKGDEKGHQVQQMGNIFKEAESVKVWLGEGNQETDFVMDCMAQMQYNRDVRGNNWRDLSELQNLPITKFEDTASIVKKMKTGLEIMLEHPWFRRVWILQEIGNARAATVLCGDKAVSASIFAQLPSLVGLQVGDHTQAVLDIMPGVSRKKSWWGQKRDLWTLLHKFGGSEATDQRDKIFSLLGISSDACESDVLRADYTLTLQEAVTKTFSFLMGCKVDGSLLPTNLDPLSPGWLTLLTETYELAFAHGNTATVALGILRGEFDLEHACASGQDPAHMAARHGHSGLVDWIFKQGAKIHCDEDDLYSHDGCSLLSWAANSGNLEQVRQLLACGTEPQFTELFSRETSRMCAIHGLERVEITDILVKHGADIERKDSRGETPLLYAIKQSRSLESIENLLKHGASIEAKSTNGQAALTSAILHHKSLKVVEVLLLHGADVKAQDSQGRTPLSWAVEPNLNNVEDELDHDGFDFEADDDQNEDPLSSVAEGKQLMIVRKLLDHGADIEAMDNQRRTPLSWAAARNQYDIVQELLHQGADVNVRDNGGRTPLILAAEGYNYLCVEELLNHGADIEARDSQGRTPLSFAAECKGYEIIQVILDRGANIEAKDNQGRTALSWAAATGGYDCIVLLLDHGAKLDSTDNDGRSPLDWALTANYTNVIQLLKSYSKRLLITREWTDTDCSSHTST